MPRPPKIRIRKAHIGDFVKVPKLNLIAEVIYLYWGRQYKTNLMMYKYGLSIYSEIKKDWIVEEFCDDEIETVTPEELEKVFGLSNNSGK